MILRGTVGLEGFDVETRCKEGAYHKSVVVELFDPKYSDSSAFLMAANAARKVGDPRANDIDRMNRVLGEASYYQTERSEYDYYEWRGKVLSFWTCERSMSQIVVAAYVAMLRLSALGSWSKREGRCALPLVAVGAAESCLSVYRFPTRVVRRAYAIVKDLRSRSATAYKVNQFVGELENQVPHHRRPQWYGRVLAAADLIAPADGYW